MSGAALPEGWVETTLGELCEERVVQAPPSNSAVPYIDIGSIDRSTKRVGLTEKVDRTTAPSRARQWVRAGDVLVSMTRPNLNAVAMVPAHLDGAVASTGFDVLRARRVDPRWLYARVRTRAFVQDICKGLQGVVYPAVRPKHIRSHVLPAPPAGTEVEILDALDSYTSRLESVDESFARVRHSLGRFRASVLIAAVAGRLVRPEAELARAEGRPYEPAADLVARALADRRRRWDETGRRGEYPEPIAPDVSSRPSLPEGWCWATVDQLATVVRGASPRPAGDPRYFGGDIPWITVGALTADDGSYLRQVDLFVTEEGRARSRYIEPDTLLLTNSGVTLGVPKITLIGGCINDGSVALQHLDYPLKLYLLYALHQKTAELRRIDQGAAQPNLNTGIVRAITVALPPTAEQFRIVAAIEAALECASDTKRTLGTAQRRASGLRQGLLEAAFSGSLDVAAASREAVRDATGNGVPESMSSNGNM